MKKILIIVLLMFVGIEVFALTNLQPIRITKVYDGDTVQGIVNGKKVNIRFLGIDCYETDTINRAYKQAYVNKITIEEVVRRGKVSKQILKGILRKSKNTEVKLNGKDKYNRDLGIIYADGVNINRYMVEHGGCLNYVYRGK